MCIDIISVQNVVKKLSTSLLILQNKVHIFNEKQVKQTKLFDLFKAGPSSKLCFIFLVSLLFVKFYTCWPTVFGEKYDTLLKSDF